MGELIGFGVTPRPPSDRPAAVREPRPREAPERLWREAVGEQLRAERLRAGRRLVDVAAEAGISPQYLSEIERGLKDPSSELLAAVVGALDLTVVELATRVVTAMTAGATAGITVPHGSTASRRLDSAHRALAPARAGGTALCLAA